MSDAGRRVFAIALLIILILIFGGAMYFSGTESLERGPNDWESDFDYFVKVLK